MKNSKSIFFLYVILLFNMNCSGTKQNNAAQTKPSLNRGYTLEIPDGFTPLFNGADFSGWEGNLKYFRIEDGIIKAGTLKKPIPRNEFLCTIKDYSDFELRLQVKTTTGDIKPYGYENGGIQFRSRRVPNHNEVSGYQADVGFELNYHKGVSDLGYSEDEFPISIWGGLYDESRRKIMFGVGDQDSLNAVMKAGEWTDYVLRCQGSRIQIWINGYKTIDYLEEDDTIERTGIIALQIHASRDPSEIWYKNIYIKELTENSSLSDSRIPSNSLKNIDIYPGLEATMFASEPMILSPTNLDIDDRGRVWVCEVVNYRAHAKNNKRPEGDRILILEDLNGDGVADTSKVYYQGRDVDAALGIAVLGNKVIVSSAPNVIVFTDEDGDDKPDRKEYLFTKSGIPQDDHSIHSFVFGPDGKLYWNMGNNGYYVHDSQGNPVIDKKGNTVFSFRATQHIEEYRGRQSPYHGGMTFRCNPDGSEFEVLAHNFRNNYEVTINSYGDLWQSDNDDDGNASCRINYLMEYGNYGYQDEITGAGWAVPRTGWHEKTPQRHWHQNDPGVVPNVVFTGAGSPAGITVYEGNLLPEVFSNRVLHCDAGPGVLWSLQEKKSGAGYTGEMLNLLKEKSDKWIRPVDVVVAPDGSVFITDWYDPVVGWNRQEDTTRGRVFRLAPKGVSYKVPKFDYSTPEGAAEALKNPSFAVRYRAWISLNSMQKQAEAELLELYHSENPVFRARALWLLTKLEENGGDHLNRGLLDEDENIRVVAIRAARQLELDMIPILESMKSDPSPQVLRECAIALSEISSEMAPSIWTELAFRYDGVDRWYLEALGIAADGRWDSFLAQWLKSVGDDWDTKKGREIIWRSRAAVTASYLSRILSSDVPSLEAERFLRAFDFQPPSRDKTEALESLVFDINYDESDKSTLIALEALLRLDGTDILADTGKRNRIMQLVENAHGTEQFVLIVSHYKLENFYPDLLKIALSSTDQVVVIKAITVLFDFDQTGLIGESLNNEESEIGSTTAAALALSRDSRSVPILLEALGNENLNTDTQSQIVRALLGTSRGSESLLEIVKAGRLPNRLKEIAGKVFSNSLNVSLRDQAADYLPIPTMRNGEAIPSMTDLLVYTGNRERGKKVFQEATCSQCHVVNGEGTDFGPNLSKIGDKLSRRGLYQSVLDPSAGISPTYTQHIIELNDGREISGYITSETSNKINVKSAGGISNVLNSIEIKAKHELPYSIMPNNLQMQLSIDDFVNLVEYMVSLK